MRLTTPASQAFLDHLKQKEYEELMTLRNLVKSQERVIDELRAQLTMCHKLHTIERKGRVN